MKTTPRIAVFASGNGSNAERIADYFSRLDLLEIAAIYSNNPEAFVLQRADKLKIPSVIFNKQDFYHSDFVIYDLQKRGVDWIVLAGFLWLIPENLLTVFPQRIINVHPALLPKYGGKGMYGMRVHEAVIAAGEPESGITIHYLNERYDEGSIIFQARCQLAKEETPDTLAAKIHKLEYAHYPRVIGELILAGIGK